MARKAKQTEEINVTTPVEEKPKRGRKPKAKIEEPAKVETKKKSTKAKKEEIEHLPVVVEEKIEEKPKRGRKPKAKIEESLPVAEPIQEETKPKRGRKPKVKAEEHLQVDETVQVKEETPKRVRKRKAVSEDQQDNDVHEIAKVDTDIKSTKAKKEEISVIEKEPEDVVESDCKESFYDPEWTYLVLDGLAQLSKETKESMVYVNDKQIRLILDNFYATQQHRMNINNQIRAVEQGFDQIQDGESPAIAWLKKDVENRENQIKKMIDQYVNTIPVCRWAMAIKGIGPIFAANLWSYMDMSKCRHATQFLSYAGLNDNNVPWLGQEKAKEIVDEAYKHFGLKASDPVTDDVILRVALASGRTGIHNIKENFLKRKAKDKKKSNDKTILTKYMAMPPYNIELKKMCYLIGESFVKVSNRNSLYGRIYRERKALENYKNERGDYAEQAAKLLAEKDYSKEKDTYKYLSEGKLSPGHIDQRARRYAVKIFLTHFFEACWLYTYHTEPPKPYVIEHQGHVDYIEPEVPYSDYIKW